MLRILVTGYDGFIGQNVMRVLQEAGHEVEGIQVYQGNSVSWDAIVHLSALAGINACHNSPTAAYLSNVKQTFDLLESIRLHSPNTHVLFASSRATETHPLSIYGATKLACEVLVRGFADAYGLRTTIMRFANVYGPYSWRKTSVIAEFIRAALKGEPLRIAGDGTQTRDFIYVGDIAEGILRLLKNPLPFVNLSGPQQFSINSLALMVNNAFGNKLQCEFYGPLEEPSQRVQNEIVASDGGFLVPERFIKVMKRRNPKLDGIAFRTSVPSTPIGDWTPQTRLPDGLELTLKWFKNFQKRNSAIPVKVS